MFFWLTAPNKVFAVLIIYMLPQAMKINFLAASAGTSTNKDGFVSIENGIDLFHIHTALFILLGGNSMVYR